MNVVYDLQAYSFSPHGGVARIFDELLPRFARRPNFSARLYRSAPLARQPPLAPNIAFTRFPELPHALRGFGACAGLHGRLEQLYWKKLRADLFHPTFYPTHDKLRGVPTIVNVYDLIHETIALADDMPDHAAFKETKKRWLQRAQRILCISDATRDELLRLYDVDEESTRVVHLACNPLFRRLDPAGARQKAGPVLKGMEQPFLLYVGSRQRYKNFHRLVQAYAMWGHFRDVALVVVGGPPRHADALVLDQAGAARNVHFVGHTDDETLNALYNLARFFVYPSACEGFGIPLLEAMAAGCPLCVSDLPVFHEVAGDGPVYFEPGDNASMHAAFDRALGLRENDNFVRTPPRPTRDFSWDRCADEVWKIYEELV